MNSSYSKQASCHTAMSGQYIALEIGRMNFLIPQHQVHTLEPAFDVQRSRGEDIGWITVAGVRSPVYDISGYLHQSHVSPGEHHVCVLLDSGSGLFGVLCDQVFIFRQSDMNIRRVPECMYTHDSPIQGLVLHGEKVLCVSSAFDLLAFLGERQELVSTSGFQQRLNGGRA